MTTEANPAKLFAKIAAVMSEVRTLEKTGRNQYDKYDYVTADAIAVTIGRAMATQKLVLLPAVVSVQTTEYTTQKGSANFHTQVNMEMTLACGDTGATWSLPWAGEAIDRSDKSISKAIVSATKYFLLKTFLLAGGDDGDADAESPMVQPAQTPATRTQPVQRHNTQAKAQKPRSASPVPQDVDFSNGTAPDNPFDGDEPTTDEEHALIGTWEKFGDAYAWAVSIEACANTHEAKNSMDKIVKAHGGYSKETRMPIMTAFIRRQNAKLAEKEAA